MGSRFIKWLGLALCVCTIAVVSLPLLVPNLKISGWKIFLNSAIGMAGNEATAPGIHERLVVRPGFRLELYDGNVAQARFLRPTPAGDLLVSQPRLGRILLLRKDADGNGHPDASEVLIDGLDRPHGLDISDGWLYVGESSAIGRVRFDIKSGHLSGTYTHILTGLPEGGNHWSRTVRIGPDGWLYATVGSSCNVCKEEHLWRASMLRLRPDGSEVTVHASGLRNSVGFDWAPWSGELFATENGRDLLGDDFPPCELNRITAGGFYGWPYLNGFNELDPDLGPGHESLIATAIPPVHGFRPHNAPLGMTFLRNPALPIEYRHAALVALHGSWNRSRPDGYKVVLLQWVDHQHRIIESDFLSGFEQAGTTIGRPVDVAEAADGSFYISDDYAGAIYRVSYRSSPPSVAVPRPAPDR